MKKIIILFLLLFFCSVSTFAKEQKDYIVDFNGEKYHLLYSVKNKDFGGYLNEYYRNGETYNAWSKMVAVHHFPNAYSPIDRIREFKEFLSSIHVPSSLTFDDKKNTAMIDFVIINTKNMPILLEFNVFKYEKSKKCGSIAIQYAQRYTATNDFQIETIKKEFEKNRKIVLKKIKKFEIPLIITEDIDKCISAASIHDNNQDEVISETKENNIAENSADTAISDNTNSENVSDVSLSTETGAENDDVQINKTDNTDNDSEKQTMQTEVEVNIENSAAAEDKTEQEQQNIDKIAEEYININPVDEFLNINHTFEQLKSTEQQSQTDNSDNNEKQTVLTAPVPEINNSSPETDINEAADSKTSKKTKKRVKAEKPVTYNISNDKSKYLASPRTNKELKAQNKLKKKTRRQVKKRAKNAAKKLAQ